MVIYSSYIHSGDPYTCDTPDWYHIFKIYIILRGSKTLGQPSPRRRCSVSISVLAPVKFRAVSAPATGRQNTQAWTKEITVFGLSAQNCDFGNLAWQQCMSVCTWVYVLYGQCRDDICKVNWTLLNCPCCCVDGAPRRLWIILPTTPPYQDSSSRRRSTGTLRGLVKPQLTR